jgi:hypothetical protein
LIYAALHGAIDLELGGRAGGAKGLATSKPRSVLFFARIALAVDRNNSETSWPGLSRPSTRWVSDTIPEAKRCIFVG